MLVIKPSVFHMLGSTLPLSYNTKLPTSSQEDLHYIHTQLTHAYGESIEVGSLSIRHYFSQVNGTLEIEKIARVLERWLSS